MNLTRPFGAFVLTLLLAATMLHAVGAAKAQDIENIARAVWQRADQSIEVLSNPVVTTVSRPAVTVETFRYDAGSGLSMDLPQTKCEIGGATLAADNSRTASASVTRTDSYRVGERIVFRFNAAFANTGADTVNRIIVIITTPAGDREILTAFETGVDTGIFAGEIATTARPPQPVEYDCRLSVASGDNVQVALHADATTGPIISTQVNILADPFGIIFDSETGDPINGARITIVDANTGLPATVFAEDGVTPWPSTVISGEDVLFGAGNVFEIGDGEYRFPLTNLGEYSFIVEPPTPYSAPSQVPPEQIALLRRPDGLPFVVNDASYGGSLLLHSPLPVRVDIPLDRPSIALSITKGVSQARAYPGDAVFYTITVRNQDADRVKRDIRVTDTPSRWLRLRRESIYIDGEAAPQDVTIAPDGGTLDIALGDIAAGASRTVSYAMIVRADAPPGRAINSAVATDIFGNEVATQASLLVDRETVGNRMTIIGRVTDGPCDTDEPRVGIPGVRVMMEDGSFAITDADGRYHFEGVVPGNHVLQAQRATLPEGGAFIDCTRSTRSAGSAESRFVSGQGGSLVVVDFHAQLPEGALALAPVVDDPVSNREAAGADTDWLALGNGPIEFLYPGTEQNPRAAATRVVVRHGADQKVELTVNNKPVDPLTYDGIRTSSDGAYAVSIWRGVAIEDGANRLQAKVVFDGGTVAADLEQMIHYSGAPLHAELVDDQSKLVADGSTRPVLAVRFTDRKGQPVRSGVSGSFTVSAPYESAQAIEALQARQLSGIGSIAPTWTIEGDDGIAYIELAPTMVSGSLKLDFDFSDRDTTRRDTIEAWMVPGDQPWTIVGLAEGSIGAKTVADNMERDGAFDSDFGEHARVAFYAKGRVLGRYLLTLSYDSAKQGDDQRLLGTIDPNAYYTVFADGSDRRFDAASRDKLYVRVETSTFYALYGDFVTGFDDTALAGYVRTATGFKGEARLGSAQIQAFAAEISTRHRRDEIQGGGISGPYTLSSRAIVPNSETVTLETRDRFRSELILESETLTRFIDYDIDLLSGTIHFIRPILSRDADFNPRFIVIDYEVDGDGEAKLNAGLRATVDVVEDKLRVGATVISDEGEGDRTDLVAADLRARIGDATEIRAEVGLSRRDGNELTAWMIEAEHHDSNLDLLAYARSVEAGYGVGQLNRAEQGRRKIGLDARYAFNDAQSLSVSAWLDESLVDESERRAVQLRGDLRRGDTDLRVGITHFDDTLTSGDNARSTMLEVGGAQRLFDNRLELSASSSIALDDAESIDLPARYRVGARYAFSQDVRLTADYEIAEGEAIDARTARVGFELTPWDGGRVTTLLGNQTIDERGQRSFAAFGLDQSFQVTNDFIVDATFDHNRTLAGGDFRDLVNPDQPAASGGQLGQSGSLFEDFTAVTLGGAYRSGAWSATARGEFRDGEFADRVGVTGGVIRQLGEGSVVGSGFTWTRAEAKGGPETEIFDGAISAAFRPGRSDVAFLTKLEYRSDAVFGAVAGGAGPAGRTALTVNGDARSRRLIGSISTNWSPRDRDDETNDFLRRSEFGLFLGSRYNFDSYEGFDLSGWSLLGGLDARVGINDHVSLGAMGSVRASVTHGLTSYSFGPMVEIAPADDLAIVVGYNIEGFEDDDFSASRYTDKGVFVSARFKFDADSFNFLGLGR